MSKDNKFDNPKKSAIVSLVAAIIFLAVDIFIALPIFTGFIFFYVLVLIPLTLFSKKNKNKHLYYRYKLIIYSLMVLISFSILSYETSVNQKEAEIVINAIYQYHQDQGEYPKELALLLPDYLDSVPGYLYYFINEENVYLSFVAVPPYGRKVWDFEKKKWNYID